AANEHRAVRGERARREPDAPDQPDRRENRSEEAAVHEEAVREELGPESDPGQSTASPSSSSIPGRRKGLPLRSSPIVVLGPWPQWQTTSSPSGKRRSRIERTSVRKEPPGRSVRPTEPWKSVSPTKATFSFSAKNVVPPSVWPGVKIVRSFKSRP